MYSATLTLLNHQPYPMIAESRNADPSNPTRSMWLENPVAKPLAESNTSDIPARAVGR